MAQAGKSYRVRIAALAPHVVDALTAAFDPQHPIGREPLVIEHVPFATLWEETGWQRMSTYASLLTAARPQRRILLEFRSPTGFRRAGGGLSAPSPRLCLEGYLRKWNAFSSVSISEEPLLRYAAEHLAFGQATLHPTETRLGRYTERGVIGQVEWKADGASPALLRVVNALADYAE